MSDKIKSTPMLLDDKPLMVYKNLAVMMGINCALILQQLRWLMDIQEEAENEYTFIDGRWWVYNSYAQWKEKHFPWLSSDTIKNSFLKMETEGFILTKQSVKHKSDRRKWYTIDFEKWNKFVENNTHEGETLPCTWGKNPPMVGEESSDGYNETTSETTSKKKDSSASVGEDSSNRVGEEPLILIERTERSKELGDMLNSFKGLEVDTSDPTHINDAKNYIANSPFQDKNHPDATTTPLIPPDKLPPANDFTHKPRTELPDGEEYNNGEVKPGPMQGGKRSTLPQEGDKARIGPTITRPTFPIESSDYAQEDEPETEEEKPKTELEKREIEMRRVGRQKEVFGTICDTLGWDVAMIPKKKLTRIGKAAKELIEIGASLWKLTKMKAWAKKKYGDKWNHAYNLGSPEKLIDLWPTFCGETKGQNVITVPRDPPKPPPDDSGEIVSKEKMDAARALMASIAAQKTIPTYNPEFKEEIDAEYEWYQQNPGKSAFDYLTYLNSTADQQREPGDTVQS